jgi:hypothetical protein
MGTNYYLYGPSCHECRHIPEPKHIGKSSAGWCFALHVYPNDGDNSINSLGDWKDYIKLDQKVNGSIIRDEYEKELTLEELLSNITERKWEGNIKGRTKEFMEANYAINGPNNLLRHKIDGSHCIGNGEGTWDLLIGDFS